MSGEGALLLACARRFVQQDQSDTVRAALRDDLDWPEVLRMAGHHSMMPLLYWVLELESPNSTPQELRDRFQDHARCNLLQTAELMRVLDLLAQNRIPAVPIKGPVLARWAYGNLALRSFLDLDLLIRREYVPLAKEVLTKEGYRLKSDIHWSSASAYLRSKDSQLSFTRAENGVSVDLHWRLLPDYFAPSFDGGEVWENLVSVSLGGRDVPSLSPEHLLLFLCAHGSKHRWECLGWICDVALVLKRVEVDWVRLLLLARQAHIERMVLLGLRLASDLFDSGLPANVRDRIDADSAVVALASEVRRTLLTIHTGARSQVDKGLINLRMLERLLDKLRFLRGLLITPTEAEWRDLRLPPALYLLYYPYRLARLVGKRTSASTSL